MANSILTPQKVTREVMRILHNNLVFCRSINRQYDDSHKTNGQRDGGSLTVRLPAKYKTVLGPALDPDDQLDNSVTVTRATQRHVDVNFTTEELTQHLDDFSERVLAPAASTLSSNVDYDAMLMYQGVGNSVGTPGTPPSDADALLGAHKYMNYFAAPQAQRMAVLNPDANASLVNGLKGLFNAPGVISQNYKSGMMANNQLGYQEISMSQNVRTHTTGDTGGSIVTSANGTDGSDTISISGMSNTTGTIRAGDVFTVAGVYSVNGETKQSTGQLQQFSVVSDGVASGGAVTLTVTPTMYDATTNRQNIDALPASGAVVTFIGAANTPYAQNLAFHKDAFIMSTADLEMPKGVHFSAREVMDGLSMRAVRQYRIGTDDIPCRFDILYGYVTARGEMACRIWG